MPSIYPTGVTRYDPARAYNCYVLFDSPDAHSHLIDMDGNDVHTWPYGGFPSYMVDPALNGGQRGNVIIHLSENAHIGKRPFFGGTFDNAQIGEITWDGTVAWKWGKDAPQGSAFQTHDLSRLANGDTLIISTYAHHIAGFAAVTALDPTIYEISPAGNIVWKWFASEHLDEFGLTPDGLAQLRAGPGSLSGFFTMNTMRILGANHWFDDGDKRFNPNNVMINSRDGDFMAIIDRETGKIVWRLGPYYDEAYASASQRIYNGKVPRSVDQLSGEHDAHIIAKGLPGAGNILVLDNQGAAGYPPTRLSQQVGSRVLEINPLTRQIVWQYTASDSDRDVWTFHTSFIGSARRLPNGNTLIDEGMNGRFFQVTPQGDIVWEYVNPHFAELFLGRDGRSNAVYRAVPIPYEWVPNGTPHSEKPIVSPDPSTFRVPGSPQ